MIWIRRTRLSCVWRGLLFATTLEVVGARRRSDCATLAVREPPSRQQGHNPHAMSQIAQHAERSAARRPGSRVRASPNTSLGSTTSYPWASTFRKSMTRRCSGIRAATSGKSRASLARASPTISNDRPLRPEVLDELAFRHVAEQRDDVLGGADRILNDGLRVTPHTAAPRRVAGIRGGGGS